jgi:23S rRNA pseudouridine2605 synthase
VRPQRDGVRPQRDDARPARDGAHPARDGERKPWSRDAKPRDGEQKQWDRDARPQRSGDGGRKPWSRDGKPADGERPRAARPADGERKPWSRDGERPRTAKPADGERKPWSRGGKPADGERKPWSRDGKPADGDRKSWGRDAKPRDGERKPWVKDGERPRGGGRASDGEKKLWTREGRPARGDRGARDLERELTEEERLARELRSVRPRHEDPEIPDEVQARDLDKVARNELRTLSKDNADWVARHLVMAARLIEDEPELAHSHALSAARRAGRIGVVRETLAITAYAIGDFALALRELRTHRRISGSNDQLPLMVDSERGVGRADRALELGRSVDRAALPADVQVSLAIAMSGARLDLGQNEAALTELEIPQLDPNRAFSWSPDLFHAYADVLDELGRGADASVWRERATRAERALGTAEDEGGDETIDVFEEDVEYDVEDDDVLDADDVFERDVAESDVNAGGDGVENDAPDEQPETDADFSQEK